MYNDNIVKNLHVYIEENINAKLIENNLPEFSSIILDAEEDEIESEVNVVFISYNVVETKILYNIDIYHTGKNGAETRKQMEIMSELLYSYSPEGRYFELVEGVLLQRTENLPAQAIHKIIIHDPFGQC